MNVVILLMLSTSLRSLHPLSLYMYVKIDLDNEGLCEWLNDLLEEDLDRAQWGKLVRPQLGVVFQDIPYQP